MPVNAWLLSLLWVKRRKIYSTIKTIKKIIKTECIWRYTPLRKDNELRGRVVALSGLMCFAFLSRVIHSLTPWILRHLLRNIFPAPMRYTPGQDVGRWDVYSPTGRTNAAGGYCPNSKFTDDQNYKLLQCAIHVGIRQCAIHVGTVTPCHKCHTSFLNS